MKAPRIHKGDLVAFKPEFNDDAWAERLAIVIKKDKFNLTVFHAGDTIKTPIWSVVMVTRGTE